VLRTACCVHGESVLRKWEAGHHAVQELEGAAPQHCCNPCKIRYAAGKDGLLRRQIAGSQQTQTGNLRHSLPATQSGHCQSAHPLHNMVSQNGTHQQLCCA
jgi:hypothetical protein